jgi:hypothetical protein
MAPKKKHAVRGKQNADAAGAAPPAAAAQAQIPSTPVFYNPNVDWHARITSAMDRIRAIYGVDIEKAEPLSSEDGYQAPCSEDVLKSRMAMDQSEWSGNIIALGGVNLLWASPLESLTPNVAINGKAVLQFMANTWPAGVVKPLAEPIDFRVDGQFPLKKGSLMRLSPEETQHALVLKIAERIEGGADAEELAAWKRCLLSASGRFVRAETFDDQYFWVTNARRRLRDAAAAVVHLASQVVCDIWMFKVRKEAQLGKSISAVEIAALYEKNMEDSTNDDEARAAPSTIENAITVYDKVFNVVQVRQIIEEVEQKLLSQSPFNSIGKLLEIYYKCKSTSKLEWWFKLAKLALDSGELEPGDLSTKKLRGAPSKPGLSDVILMKRSMKEFFMTRFLDTRNIHTDFKQKLRLIFDSPTSFSAKFQHSGDTSFLATWPQSASKTLDMVECTCFTFIAHDDSTMKTGIKAGKTAQEILEEYQPWKSQIEEIDACLRAEHSTMKVDEDGEDVPVKASTGSGPSAAIQTPSGSGSTTTTAMDQLPKFLSAVDDKWIDHVRRHISKFCVLIVESSLTQTQLSHALAGVALGTVQGWMAQNPIQITRVRI